MPLGPIVPSGGRSVKITCLNSVVGLKLVGDHLLGSLQKQLIKRTYQRWDPVRLGIPLRFLNIHIENNTKKQSAFDEKVVIV